MREFFRGWRRKAGCAALLMAVTTTCMWCRSYFFLETLRIPRGEARTDFLESYHGRFNWARIQDLRPVSPQLSLTWKSQRLSGKEGSWISQRTLNQIWDYRGYGVWERRERHNTRRVLVIPYWSVAIPLTLLSAILLLWPRAKEQPHA